MNDEVIKLGKKIIKENEIKEYDMLNQWMINYIAEKMYEYENEENISMKDIVGAKCREAILSFWSSRGNNSMLNPFTDYTEIYRGVENLAVSSESTFLDGIFNRIDMDNEDLAQDIKIIKRCTNKLIKNILYDYINEIKDEYLLEWIGVTKEIEGNEDAKILDDILHFDILNTYNEIIDRELFELQRIVNLYKNLEKKTLALKESS